MSFFEGPIRSSTWWDGPNESRPSAPKPELRSKTKARVSTKAAFQPEQPQGDDPFVLHPVHRPRYQDPAPKFKSSGKAPARKKGVERLRPEPSDFKEGPSYRAPSHHVHPANQYEPSYDQVGANPEYYTPESVDIPKVPVRKRPSPSKSDTSTGKVKSQKKRPVSRVPQLDISDSEPLYPSYPSYPSSRDNYEESVSEQPLAYQPDTKIPQFRYPADADEPVYPQYRPEQDAFENGPAFPSYPPPEYDDLPEPFYEPNDKKPEFYRPESVPKRPIRPLAPTSDSSGYLLEPSYDPSDKEPEFYRPESVKKRPNRPAAPTADASVLLTEPDYLQPEIPKNRRRKPARKPQYDIPEETLAVEQEPYQPADNDGSLPDESVLLNGHLMKSIPPAVRPLSYLNAAVDNIQGQQNPADGPSDEYNTQRQRPRPKLRKPQQSSQDPSSVSCSSCFIFNVHSLAY